MDVDDVVIRRRPVIEQGAARIERLANRLGWPEIAPGLFAFAVLLAVGLADGGVFPRTIQLTIGNTQLPTVKLVAGSIFVG